MRSRPAEGVGIGNVVTNFAERGNGVVVVTSDPATDIRILEKGGTTELVVPARTEVSAPLVSYSLGSRLGRVRSLVDVVVELLDSSRDDAASTGRPCGHNKLSILILNDRTADRGLRALARSDVVDGARGEAKRVDLTGRAEIVHLVV